MLPITRFGGSMQVFLGALVVAVTLAVFADRLLTRRGRRAVHPLSMTPAARHATSIIIFSLAAVAAAPGIFPQLRIGIFAFCGVCPIGSVGADSAATPGGFLSTFLVACWYYAATVLPIFLVASLISGLLMTRWRRFTPRNAVTAFLVAGLLPVCSCGVIPVARAMLVRGDRGVRAALVFLTTAPLLSPVIVFLGLNVLGIGYLAVRVVAAAVVAVVAALVVTPHVARANSARDETASVASCECGKDGSCAPADPVDRIVAVRPTDSVLDAAGRTSLSLLPFVLYGIVIGSAVAAAIPPDYVGAIVRTGILSLAASTVVGLPINMCAGEEILLVGPLVNMGLPMGHALAFSLASTGICAGSIPLLVAVIGRRATLVLAAVYLVVPFLLGLLLNALPLGAAIGPQPF